MAEIVLDHVNKSYPDGHTAVRDLNLTIADGEFLILVGPSGCGKTTTLNMIAGLEDISSGELRIAGERVNEKAPKDRDIAMVFQSYALYPHMTVRQNIAFPLTLAKMRKADIAQKVSETAKILDLTNLLDRKPSQLSGGQRQRVAMGRAIVRHPKAFLMDEPLSNLDAKLRVQMRGEIAQLQRRLGTTTVYVTHDQTEAMTLGDRVVVMYGGIAQQIGTPEELYERPANLFVAGFIGSPAMNFFPARLTAIGLTLPFGEVTLAPEVQGVIAAHRTGKRHRRRAAGAYPGRSIDRRVSTHQGADLPGEGQLGRVFRRRQISVFHYREPGCALGSVGRVGGGRGGVGVTRKSVRGKGSRRVQGSHRAVGRVGFRYRQTCRLRRRLRCEPDHSAPRLMAASGHISPRHAEGFGAFCVCSPTRS